jgi:glycosyltransferase involved in cell wall biosynthesis
VGLVSVVIPCYNQAHFLSEAIESVASQTYEPTETIVVDDGSTDDTSHVADVHGVRCVRQENRGLAEARNTGLRASSGDMLLFLDADDLLAPDAIDAGVSASSANRTRPLSSAGLRWSVFPAAGYRRSSRVIITAIFSNAT